MTEFIAGVTSNDITFFVNDDEEIIKICGDGNFYVKGKLVDNDAELYKAFVKFFKEVGVYYET
jgi:hypothetical protein